MVLRSCILRDANVLYMQIGSVRLVNVSALESSKRCTKEQDLHGTCRSPQQAQQNTGTN